MFVVAREHDNPVLENSFGSCYVRRFRFLYMRFDVVSRIL